MISTLDFFLLVFPFTLVAFFFVKHLLPKVSHIVLLIGLYFLLFQASPFALLLLFVTSSINYLLQRLLLKQKKPFWLLVLGILIALLPLFWFKFIADIGGDDQSNASGFLFTLGIPIGLSFYALHQVSVLLDSYKEKFTPLSFSRHLLYLGFFPNFAAGPVFVYQDAREAFRSLGRIDVPQSWIGNGLALYMFGLAKKLWIANPLGGAIDHIYSFYSTGDKPWGMVEAWYVVWGFLVQLYFDFSAYSDMAIGLAMCFGILLPINFDSPLKAYTTQEYIARWHMSFTHFVKIYLFVPILSLMKKLPIKNTARRMSFAWGAGMFISYLAIGVWHSPNVTIMLTTVVVIFILFMCKLPSVISGKLQVNVVSGFERQINRTTILVFSMLMATGLKVQDLSIMKEVYSSLINFSELSLPGRLSHFLPSKLAELGRFDGFAIALDNFQQGAFVFSSKIAYVFVLILATLGIFLLPNSMELFGIKNSKKSSVFKNGDGWRFYSIFTSLFILVVFAAIFENHNLDSFIYDKF